MPEPAQIYPCRHRKNPACSRPVHGIARYDKWRGNRPWRCTSSASLVRPHCQETAKVHICRRLKPRSTPTESKYPPPAVGSETIPHLGPAQRHNLVSTAWLTCKEAHTCAWPTLPSALSVLRQPLSPRTRPSVAFRPEPISLFVIFVVNRNTPQMHGSSQCRAL